MIISNKKITRLTFNFKTEFSNKQKLFLAADFFYSF